MRNYKTCYKLTTNSMLNGVFQIFNGEHIPISELLFQLLIKCEANSLIGRGWPYSVAECQAFTEDRTLLLL